MARSARSRRTVRTRHDEARGLIEARLLEAVLRRPGSTKAELAAAVGHSRPTVSSVLASLHARGLVRSSTRVSGTRGRRPQVWTFDPRARLVAGVDLGGTKLHVAVGTLDGTILAESVAATRGDRGEVLIHQIVDEIRAVLAASGGRRGDLGRVVLGSPGIVEPDGTMRYADNLPGLRGVRVGERISDLLQVPVDVENDVNLAAFGEHRSGNARRCQNFVELSVGTGIGMGIFMTGKLVRGSGGAAGEVAYMPIGSDPRTAEARSRGAFEVAAAGSGVEALLEQSRRSGLTTVLGARPSVEEIFAAARGGDPLACEVVERHATLLAEGILAVCAVLDPEMVVLAGGIGTNEVLLEPIRSALEDITPSPVKVAVSALGPKAGLVGAVLFAADAQLRDILEQTRSGRHAASARRRGRRPGRRSRTS